LRLPCWETTIATLHWYQKKLNYSSEEFQKH
jgi:hypothetical protein